MKAARHTVVGIAALCASGALVGTMIVGSGPVALCAGGCMTKGIPGKLFQEASVVAWLCCS